MDSNFWTTISAISTSIAAIAAVGSLIFFIMQFLSENRPIIILKENKNKNKGFLLKNIGNKTAVSICVEGTLSIHSEALLPNKVLTFDYFNIGDIQEISYKRFKWSRKFYERKRNNTATNRGNLDRIDSFAGKLKIARILKLTLKSANEGNLVIRLRCIGGGSVSLDCVFKNSDGFLDKIEEKFSGGLLINSFYILKLLKINKFIHDDGVKNEKSGSVLLEITKIDLADFLNKNLLFPIFNSTVRHSEYISIAEVIKGFRKYYKESNMREDIKIKRNRKNEISFLFPDSKINNYAYSLGVSNRYFIENSEIITIADSRETLAASAFFSSTLPGLTIFNKRSKVFYSSDEPKFSSQRMSRQQETDFIESFRYIANMSKKKPMNNIFIKTKYSLKSLTYKPKIIEFKIDRPDDENLKSFLEKLN